VVDMYEVNAIKWTEDTVRKEAKKYNSKTEFQIGSRGAYTASIRLGIINDLGFVNKYKSWDEESIRQEAKKYNTRTEFAKGNISAYTASIRLGIINDLGFKVVGNLYKRMIYAFIFKENNAVYVGLTYNENVRSKQHLKIDNVGNKVSPVKLFMNKTGETPKMVKLTDYLPIEDAVVKENEYEKYYRNLGYHILNIAKTGSLGGTITKWTEDKIRQEAKKYNSKSEFEVGSRNAYKASLRLGIINDLGFVNIRKSWDEDSVRREAKKYNSKSEFEVGNPSAYQASVRLGIINDLGFVNKLKSWDEESIRKEAKKYNTKIEFIKGNISAYEAAKRLGIFDDLGFVNIRKYWDEESIRQEAKKYNNRTEFQKGSGGAYNMALRLGLLDILFPKKQSDDDSIM
jgi:hypothetical protein